MQRLLAPDISTPGLLYYTTNERGITKKKLKNKFDLYCVCVVSLII
jgi:hypothetical protein